MPDTVDIFVNGKEYISVVEERQVLGYIMSTCIRSLEHMSDDAIISWILTGCELVDEAFPENKSVKRKSSALRKQLTTKKYSREMLQQIAIGIYFSAVGMGTIPGLGYGIVRGKKNDVLKTNLNPELLSTYRYNNRRF